MSHIKLRDYQSVTIDKIMAAWIGGMKRPMATLATGLGKTIIFSWLIRELIGYSRARPLVLVHRDALVRQTRDTLKMVDPTMDVGIIRGAQKELGRQATVASVATLGRKATLDRIGPWAYTHVIVDECHHAAAPTYRRILDHFATYSVGFTATPARGDGVGLGSVWDAEVIRYDTLWGIVNGHLTDVRGHAVTVDGLDLATVARSHGDYAEASLGQAMVAAGAGPVIANAYREHARLDDGALRKGILFAPDVPSAEAFAVDLNAAGIRTAAITGTTPAEVRQRRYADVRDGRLDVLASCMVLTEGFDLPAMSCAAIARPTQSQPLFAQMVGRVLRPAPGKRDALVLDVCGIGGHHGLIGVADLAISAETDDETAVTELGPLYDDESLLEGLIRQESEIVSDALGRRISGRLAAKTFDLFDRSEHAWLTTRGGTWFIPTRAGYFFLLPEDRPGRDPSTVRLGKTANQRRIRGLASAMRDPEHPDAPLDPEHWGWVQDGLTQSVAMAWAESLAGQLDPTVSSRNASWRRGKQAPSEPQRQQAIRAGIVVPDGITKAELSDLLSVHYASRILDK